MTTSSETTVLDQASAVDTFYEDVVSGLRQHRRSIHCKYLYDARGSTLFEAICELDEYYLTRTELAIMRRFAGEMGEQIGPGVMLVEYGSGSGVKTRILLDHLPDPAAYVPVDISRDHLQQSADELARRYPQIEVLPVYADFTEDFELPSSLQTPTHHAVYFPGSTIGNFEPTEAKAMLVRVAQLCGSGGGLLIGIDLQKNAEIIEAAYNDARGVTAAFNLNLLHRINRELHGDFAVDQFEHHAHYNARLGRVELSLVSRRDQTVRVGDESFKFTAGEMIHTEYSHKYTIDGFAELAGGAGLTLRKSWTDRRDYFAVLHFAAID